MLNPPNGAGSPGRTRRPAEHGSTSRRVAAGDPPCRIDPDLLHTPATADDAPDRGMRTEPGDVEKSAAPTVSTTTVVRCPIGTPPA